MILFFVETQVCKCLCRRKPETLSRKHGRFSGKSLLEWFVFLLIRMFSMSYSKQVFSFCRKKTIVKITLKCLIFFHGHSWAPAVWGASSCFPRYRIKDLYFRCLPRKGNSMPASCPGASASGPFWEPGCWDHLGLPHPRSLRQSCWRGQLPSPLLPPRMRPARSSLRKSSRLRAPQASSWWPFTPGRR